MGVTQLVGFKFRFKKFIHRLRNFDKFTLCKTDQLDVCLLQGVLRNKEEEPSGLKDLATGVRVHMLKNLCLRTWTKERKV